MRMYRKPLRHFMDEAEAMKKYSDDPGTQTGAVIVNQVGKIIGRGCNKLPMGLKKFPERLTRPEKYKWIEHAERNAIYSTVTRGYSTLNAAMIMTWYPCIDCARAIIQSGITGIVCRTPDWNNQRWGGDFKIVKQMFIEAGIKVEYCDNRPTGQGE